MEICTLECGTKRNQLTFECEMEELKQKRVDLKLDSIAAAKKRYQELANDGWRDAGGEHVHQTGRGDHRRGNRHRFAVDQHRSREMG